MGVSLKMAQKKIFIVEDEEDIIELLKFNLKQEGYSVKYETSGEFAVGAITSEQPDLIILDVMIPGKDGFQICRELKASHKTSGIPVIFLTAKSEEYQVVSGLELGANDFITKPFSMGILIARVRANLRQSIVKGVTEDELVFGDLKLYPQKYSVTLKSDRIEFSQAEFKLLFFLVQKPGWVYSRDQLIDACKGENYIITDRSIDVMMVSIRKKLGDYASCIKTVRGVGYKFLDPNEL